MLALRRPEYTPDDYLALEREAEAKHEYWHGDIYAMAGGSLRHNRLAGKCMILLGNALGDGPCIPFGSDQRVHVPATGSYCYPDLTVVCGRIQRDPADQDSVVNPRLLVEVLSQSTEDFDRGGKFDAYRSVDSLAEVVFVRQDRAQMEVRRRADGGGWTLEYFRAGDTAVLESVGARIAVDELYAGVFEIPGDDPE